MLLTWVEVRDAIGMGLASLRANKLRTGLTILGVMIGVSSVIGLASIVDGLDQAIEDEIASIGSNIIEIDRFPPEVDYDELTDEERNRPYMGAGEAEAIKAHCPSVDGVAPQNHYWAPGGNVIKYKNKKFTDARYHGTWPDYMRIRDKSLQAGRFFTDTDVNLRAMVCVVGADVAKGLFEEKSAIGRVVRVNGKRFQIIGVFDEVESNFGNDYENNLVSIPLSTFEKLHPWDDALTLVARSKDYESIELAKEEIIAALRVYRSTKITISPCQRRTLSANRWAILPSTYIWR